MASTTAWRSPSTRWITAWRTRWSTAWRSQSTRWITAWRSQSIRWSTAWRSQSTRWITAWRSQSTRWSTASPRVPDGAQHGGPRVPDGAQHGGPRVPDGAQQHGGPQVPDGEAGQREPSQLDLLSVIAIGMRQLQDAQTKAFQKKTTAAVLKGPDPATSPVEVQDWLQLLQAPMSDLSDNSGDWWWPRSPTRSGPERRQWSG